MGTPIAVRMIPPFLVCLFLLLSMIDSRLSSEYLDQERAIALAPQTRCLMQNSD